jgi:hypothetical protein
MKNKKGGFIIILVISVMAILVLAASVIIDMGCGEAIQVRTQNDYTAAGYAAAAGAERMYAIIANRWQSTATEEWTTLTLAQTNLVVDGVTVGKYKADAYKSNNPREFYIVAVGEVNNRSVTITTKYGYMVDYSNGVPLSSVGNISLEGHKVLFWKFMVNADGPINSASLIVPNGNADPAYSPTNRYVQYTGTVNQNTPVTAPSFWLHSRFDTTGTNVAIPHSNPDYITLEEATAQEAVSPGALAAFNANNVYKSTTQDADRIDDKDGFYYYYTGYLDKAENNSTGTHLEIGKDVNGSPEANYISTDTTYGPWSVGSGKKIIFVDGNVNVLFNAQQYWNDPSDLTIVSMKDINIIQPVNGPDDRMTLISCGDISTGGINLGDNADVKGNLVLCSMGDFNAVLGGITNGSIFSGGGVFVDTRWLIIYSARDFNMGTDNWANSANWPLGLPPSYPVFNRGYHVRTEGLGTDLSANFNPRWQKRKND